MNYSSLITNAKSGINGEYDENYAQSYTKLTKGRYALIPFSNIKGGNGVYLNLEI